MVRDRRDGDADGRLSAFTWRDGERTIRFGRGVAAEAVALLGGPGYALLTTERAARGAPAVVAAAGAVHEVGPGEVPELAAALLDRIAGEVPEPAGTLLDRIVAAGEVPKPGGALLEQVSGNRIVALGGGRVVDTAKAVAAARGARAMAVPTTLSGAEMTRSHRHALGVPQDTPQVRCAVVICDPALAASQPEPDLAASALNALGHAVEAPCTVAANPVSTLAAHEAARLLCGAFAGRGPDRDALALGGLLAGYTIDSAGFGLHHVMAQTVVRLGLTSHRHANAILLPHTIGALAWRFPAQHAALAEALGEDPAEAAARLRALTGVERLRDVGVEPAALDACADAAAARAQLAHTPPRADRAELRALYEAAR